MAVSFGQTEIDAVDEVAISTATVRDKVSRFNITMNQVTRVHQFYALKHLIGDHENGLERESSSTLVELILEGRTQKVHHHKIVGILSSEVVDLGESGGILQFPINLVFVTQLRTPSTMLLELHGNLFTIGTNPEVNVSERTTTNAFGDPVFLLKNGVIG